MGGTKHGGKKAAQTVKERHGEDFYKRMGALGGRKKVPKGFALMSPEKRSAAGRKGGANSKRGKKK